MPTMPEYDETLRIPIEYDIGPDSDDPDFYDEEAQTERNRQTWLIWTNTPHIDGMTIW